MINEHTYEREVAMKRKVFIQAGILILTLALGVFSPVHAVIADSVDGYEVTCGNITSNGDLLIVSLHVQDGSGAPVPCAVVKVDAALKINIKIAKQFNSKNTVRISTFSTPTDADGNTTISLPEINDSMTVDKKPKRKVELTLTPSCAEISPTNVYILEDCTNKVPKGSCQASITVPSVLNKTYAFCYSSYDIAEADYEGNCAELEEIYNLFKQLFSIIGIRGFEFFVEYTELYSCNYEIGQSSIPTAVTIASFNAQPDSDTVMIKWTTGDETDNLGFNIYRSGAKNGAYSKINDTLIASKAGAGLGASYELVDDGVHNRTTYFYKLEDVDIYGVKTMHGPVRSTPRSIYGLMH
jgi:hypothetical protein